MNTLNVSNIFGQSDGKLLPETLWLTNSHHEWWCCSCCRVWFSIYAFFFCVCVCLHWNFTVDLSYNPGSVHWNIGLYFTSHIIITAFNYTACLSNIVQHHVKLMTEIKTYSHVESDESRVRKGAQCILGGLSVEEAYSKINNVWIEVAWASLLL